MKLIWAFDKDSYPCMRGGSWIDFPHHARIANRGWYATDTHSSYLGFRLYRGVR
jgi:formylglycine-generating enzyme required for sulfatase activity